MAKPDNVDPVAEVKDEAKSAETPGFSSKEYKRGGAAKKRAAGGPVDDTDQDDRPIEKKKGGTVMKRARGGKISGGSPKMNPGQKARGRSDTAPYTSAGSMNEPSYVKGTGGGSTENGKGMDNNGPYRG